MTAAARKPYAPPGAVHLAGGSQHEREGLSPHDPAPGPYSARPAPYSRDADQVFDAARPARWLGHMHAASLRDLLAARAVLARHPELAAEHRAEVARLKREADDAR